MISREDLKVYIKPLKNGQHRCYFCFEIMTDYPRFFYEIRKIDLESIDNRYSHHRDGGRHSIIFHKECFKQIAGEEFMFSDE